MKKISAAAIVGLLCSTVVTALPAPVQIIRSNNGNIVFDCTIPSDDKQLPSFSLGTHAQFPPAKFDNILKSAAPGANLTEKNVDGSRYIYDGDLLVGYFDSTTGETAVFPKLGSLNPMTNTDPGDVSSFSTDGNVVPGDDTENSHVQGSKLTASQKTVDGDVTPPTTYLSEKIIQRHVRHGGQRFDIHGSGTKASFSFGSDGSVKGLKHKWRPAKNLGATIKPISQDLIQKNIAAQLLAINTKGNITVKSVDLSFFDSGKSFIQPAFRYNAIVSYPLGLSDELITGYIPAGGKELEPLPSLTPPTDQVMPTTAKNSTTSKRQSGGITVGRYAMSNDQYSGQIVVDENAFWNGLSSVSSGFVNKQYYWDEPYMYEGSAPYYADSVNVAFTEGHGNVHLFTTNELEANWGAVYIPSSLPASGFGPGAGGALAYWIIRACDTVSTPVDYSAANYYMAFDPWWQVFNGMHAVLGYHTLAAVYDNEMGNVGRVLGQGASVVHGWLTAAAGGGGTSAVTVCGHADDTIYQINNLGKPGCLQIWWNG